MSIAINERVQILVSRDEPNFDRACDQAFRLALVKFDVDESGHINAVIGSDRSEDTLVVEFARYERCATMVGHCHNYIFSAFVSKTPEE